MTSCDRNPNIERIVDKVLCLIDEERLRERIDKPLQAAMAAFDVKGRCSSPLSSQAFLDLAAEFIAHLYRNGFRYSIELTPRQARAETLFILQHTYQGHHADGYAGALKDAQTYGETGLTSIFASMVEVLTRTQRQRYIRSVMADKVLYLPWPTCRDLAAFILEHWAELLSPALRECRPQQIADLCPELIQGLASSDQAVRELLASFVRKTFQADANH
jgi:hypothetical protein